MGRWQPDIIEGFSDTADDNPISRWSFGVVCAGALAAYAASGILMGRILIPGLRPLRLFPLHGSSATAAAFAYLSIAAFLHAHFFWSNSPRFWGYAQLGKTIAAAGIIASLGALFYSFV